MHQTNFYIFVLIKGMLFFSKMTVKSYQVDFEVACFMGVPVTVVASIDYNYMRKIPHNLTSFIS